MPVPDERAVGEDRKAGSAGRSAGIKDEERRAGHRRLPRAAHLDEAAAERARQERTAGWRPRLPPPLKRRIADRYPLREARLNIEADLVTCRRIVASGHYRRSR